MKLSPLLVILLFAAVSCLQAQTPPASDVDTTGAVTDTSAEVPAAGSTVITSDELHMDQVNHVAVFTGNVVTTGTNFNMKCQEMTVNFDKAGKIDNIVAKGSVVIVQPGRVTKCGQAIYYRDEDRFDLSDQPVINDNGKIISAPKITIFRSKQSLYTSGRSTTTIPEGSAFSKPPSPDQK